jgi:hypothetical protein
MSNYEDISNSEYSRYESSQQNTIVQENIAIEENITVQENITTQIDTNTQESGAASLSVKKRTSKIYQYFSFESDERWHCKYCK